MNAFCMFIISNRHGATLKIQKGIYSIRMDASVFISAVCQPLDQHCTVRQNSKFHSK